ncbi:hypothetical protein Clacol_006200 [Clathrus columnatus]|uniref:NAD-dependent epimerase/dehydratase domain-containing protein n=1 Tax=Clathrus columnatus TaxID=1419009 RepID=A0AAV5AE15_9AGAM|nr:hypothetical protein Clacol_006200 [Clathrus columnatus]
MSKNVFITGITGYIGSEATAQLISAPSTSIHKYAALIRNSSKASVVDSLGIRPVVASLDDNQVLSEEAYKADIIIHLADSADHVPAFNALSKGMKRREAEGKETIYIHCSSTGSIIEDSRGEFATDKIYHDLDKSKLGPHDVPDNALHRNVDLLVLAASSNLIKTHIISPSTVYGLADNVFVQRGISNKSSVQVPLLIRAGIDRQQGGVEGKGLNTLPIGSAIRFLLEKAIEGKTATGRDGYYFAETGEYIHRDTARKIAELLAARGIGKPEPNQFSEEEVERYFRGTLLVGSSCRCRGERIRALGWEPQYNSEHFYESLEAEVDNEIAAARR